MPLYDQASVTTASVTAAAAAAQAAAEAASDPAGSASTAQSNAETYAAGQVSAAQPTLAECATVYVTTGGSDSNSGLSWTSAFADIATAVAALGTAGGIVEVGYGNFNISSPVVVSGTTHYGVTIRGRGMGMTYDASNSVTSPTHPTSVTNTNASGGDAFQVTGSQGTAPPSYGFLLEDLAVIGNSSSGNGLTANFAPRIKLSRVAFDLHGVWGILCENGCYWLDLEDVTATRCGTTGASVATGGFGANTGSWQFNLALFKNCVFNYNNGFGVWLAGATVANFLNTDFSRTVASSYASSGTGCYFGASESPGPVNFFGCWFEGNANVGCSAQSNGSANFYGCAFFGDGTEGYGLSLPGGGTANLDGCWFSGHNSGYSIYNHYATKVRWAGCTSSDSSGFMNTVGTWAPDISAAAANSAGVIGEGNSGGLYNQAQGTAGAAVFDASTGNVQVMTLNANATSSSITNAAPGQTVTISWLIGVGGGFTYAWPSNCKFAGGAAPSHTTTAGNRDTVTFFFDGTNFHEIARAANSG